METTDAGGSRPRHTNSGMANIPIKLLMALASDTALASGRHAPGHPDVGGLGPAAVGDVAVVAEAGRGARGEARQHSPVRLVAAAAQRRGRGLGAAPALVQPPLEVSAAVHCTRPAQYITSGVNIL